MPRMESQHNKLQLMINCATLPTSEKIRLSQMMSDLYERVTTLHPEYSGDTFASRRVAAEFLLADRLYKDVGAAIETYVRGRETMTAIMVGPAYDAPVTNCMQLSEVHLNVSAGDTPDEDATKESISEQFYRMFGGLSSDEA